MKIDVKEFENMLDDLIQHAIEDEHYNRDMTLNEDGEYLKARLTQAFKTLYEAQKIALVDDL